MKNQLILTKGITWPGRFGSAVAGFRPRRQVSKSSIFLRETAVNRIFKLLKILSSMSLFWRQIQFWRSICAAAVLLVAAKVQAQNLFVSSYGSGNIYEYTPGGVRSTFASGLNFPVGLAFNSAGDLFEADQGSGNIYKFTPGGVRSTFASGLAGPSILTFNSAGILFEDNAGNNNIRSEEHTSEFQSPMYLV